MNDQLVEADTTVSKLSTVCLIKQSLVDNIE